MGGLKDDKQVKRTKRSTYRFVESWLDFPEFKGWLTKKSSSKAYCKVCQCDILPHKSISRHGSSTKHKFSYKQVAQNKKKSDMCHSSMLMSNIKRAELKLCLFLAAKNLSFSVMDTLTPLLGNIFPDSQIAKGLSLKRTKATAVIVESLGKVFRRVKC